jgi:hypothetical protein
MHETTPFYAKPIFRLAVPVTEETAFDTVAGYLACRTDNTELLIHEKPSGDLSIYYYESARYLRTQNPAHALPENAPILIDTTTGEGFLTGPRRPIAECRGVQPIPRLTRSGGSTTQKLIIFFFVLREVWHASCKQ